MRLTREDDGPLFIHYNDPSFTLGELRAGDKLWKSCYTEVKVFVQGVESFDPKHVVFQDGITFVASLNVDMKFKVYYGDYSIEPEYIALNGKKLRIGDTKLAESLFIDLVEAGWRFHY